jgi:hypothetical protein
MADTIYIVHWSRSLYQRRTNDEYYVRLADARDCYRDLLAEHQPLVELYKLPPALTTKRA